MCAAASRRTAAPKRHTCTAMAVACHPKVCLPPLIITEEPEEVDLPAAWTETEASDVLGVEEQAAFLAVAQGLDAKTRKNVMAALDTMNASEQSAFLGQVQRKCDRQHAKRELALAMRKDAQCDSARRCYAGPMYGFETGRVSPVHSAGRVVSPAHARATSPSHARATSPSHAARAASPSTPPHGAHGGLGAAAVGRSPSRGALPRGSGSVALSPSQLPPAPPPPPPPLGFLEVVAKALPSSPARAAWRGRSSPIGAIGTLLGPLVPPSPSLVFSYSVSAVGTVE